MPDNQGVNSYRVDFKKAPETDDPVSGAFNYPSISIHFRYMEQKQLIRNSA